WRHAPHGGVAVGDELVTTTASMCRAPEATAWDAATRSAQIASPYDAFSTFAPLNVPASVETADPTKKLLYGAYARPRACRARSSRRSTSSATAVLRLFLRRPNDEHLRDAAPLHLLGGEPEVLDRDGFALRRHGADQAVHRPADGVPFVVREVGLAQLVPVVDRHAPC